MNPSKQNVHNSQQVPKQPTAPPTGNRAGWDPNVKQVTQRPLGFGAGTGGSQYAGKQNVGQQQSGYPQGEISFLQLLFKTVVNRNYLYIKLIS